MFIKWSEVTFDTPLMHSYVLLIGSILIFALSAKTSNLIMKIYKEKYIILHRRFLICHLLNTKNKQQLSKSFKYYNFYYFFFTFWTFDQIWYIYDSYFGGMDKFRLWCINDERVTISDI